MKEKDLFKINLQLFAEGEENKEKSVDYKALLEKQKEAYEALLKQKEEETNKKLIEIQTELEKEKLDKMDAEKKKAYLEQKAKLEEEERFSNLVKDLEEKNNKIAEYEKAIKEKEFKEEMLKLVADKPYMAEEAKNYRSMEDYNLFGKPLESRLKTLWEYEQKNREAGKDAFKGFNINDGDKKDLSLDEIMAEKLKNRKQ